MLNLNKYIYISEKDGYGSVLCNVDYDSNKITKMINEYSLATGANVIDKKYLGSISDYPDGRIIEKKVNHIKDRNKIIGLSTDPKSIYLYKIIVNESKFIKALISSIKRIDFDKYRGSYILLDFSEIYSMLINNEISENDLLFLHQFFNEINIIPKAYEKVQDNINEVSKKNSYILNVFNKCDLNLNNEFKNNENVGKLAKNLTANIENGSILRKTPSNSVDYYDEQVEELCLYRYKRYLGSLRYLLDTQNMRQAIQEEVKKKTKSLIKEKKLNSK